MNIPESKKKAEKLKAKWASDKHTLSTVRNLKSLGLTNEEMSSIFGFKSRQLRRLQENHPEFRQALADGKNNLHDRLVAQMVVAAAGYDYDEVKVEEIAVPKKRGGTKYVTTKKTTTTKHCPANAPLFMFLMTNQWGDPTERWSGWKIRRDALPSKNLTIKIDGKVESDKICKLAGRLFGSDTPEHPRKPVLEAKAVEDANRGCGGEERLSGVVPVKTADSV